MTQKNRLAAVPDSSMLALYRAMVVFLSEEARGRGWDEVTERLKAVEAALMERRPEA